MDFWCGRMPAGMFLRSSWDASHIADPKGALRLENFMQTCGVKLTRPVPLYGFIQYGRWFQQQVAPDLDQRRVEQVTADEDGFRLVLEDSEAIEASRVIVACGIARFAFRPSLFANFPRALVSHSSDHHDLKRFKGQHVVVIGGGQSALENAALLTENGAHVEVIARAHAIRWLKRSGWLHRRKGLVRELLYPPTDVGPPVLNQLVARPDLFRLMPRTWQDWIAYRSIRPAVSGWIQPRCDGVKITTGRCVTAAEPVGDRVTIRLDDFTTRTVDHVMLATGFQIDISRLPFLAPELMREVCCAQGYPVLTAGLESSVRGLHFVGAPAAWSFGPLMRFVSGAGYASSAVTRAITRSAPAHTNGRGTSHHEN